MNEVKKLALGLLIILLLFCGVQAGAENVSISPALEERILQMAHRWLSYPEDQLKQVKIELDMEKQEEAVTDQWAYYSFVCPDDEAYKSLEKCSVIAFSDGVLHLAMNPLVNYADVESRISKGIPELKAEMLEHLETQHPFLKDSSEILHVSSTTPEKTGSVDMWLFEQVYEYKTGTEHPLSGFKVEIVYAPAFDVILWIREIPSP